MGVRACGPVPPAWPARTLLVLWDSAREQRETGRGGQGKGVPPAKGPCPLGRGERGKDPRAGPRRACPPGVSAPRDKPLRPGRDLSPILLAPQGTHVPEDRLRLPRRRRPVRRCERRPRPTRPGVFLGGAGPGVSSLCGRFGQVREGLPSTPPQRCLLRVCPPGQVKAYFCYEAALLLSPPQRWPPLPADAARPGLSQRELLSLFRCCSSEAERAARPGPRQSCQPAASPPALRSPTDTAPGPAQASIC